MKNLTLLLLCMVVFSCKTNLNTVSKEEKSSTNFYFIRHAEKDNDGTKNPDLSPLGLQRATNYINFFKDIKIDAIYTTNFKRTVNTIMPIANERNLTPIYYNPNKINSKDFITKHKDQTVIVVGHSNTTPEFANKIIGKMTYSQMMEDNFSAIYKVTVYDSIVKHELLKMN